MSGDVLHPLAEWHDSEPVATEFYTPFIKAANEETMAARVRRLQFDRKQALQGETNCRRKASTWAMRANNHRKEAQHLTDELRALGVEP